MSEVYEPLNDFDPNRLRDLLDMLVTGCGGWDFVTDADLAQVQRTLLADAAYLRAEPCTECTAPHCDPTDSTASCSRTCCPCRQIAWRTKEQDRGGAI